AEVALLAGHGQGGEDRIDEALGGAHSPRNFARPRPLDDEPDALFADQGMAGDGVSDVTLPRALRDRRRARRVDRGEGGGAIVDRVERREVDAARLQPGGSRVARGA